MAIFLMKWPFLVKICMRDLSLPRSHTTNLLFERITATFLGYHSCPSSLPGTPNCILNVPSFSKISIRWLFVSATIISSSTPKQNPCGELNCTRDGPRLPNLYRMCIGVAFMRPGILTLFPFRFILLMPFIPLMPFNPFRAFSPFMFSFNEVIVLTGDVDDGIE